jgi:hypothetical protein
MPAATAHDGPAPTGARPVSASASVPVASRIAPPAEQGALPVGTPGPQPRVYGRPIRTEPVDGEPAAAHVFPAPPAPAERDPDPSPHRGTAGAHAAPPVSNGTVFGSSSSAGGASTGSTFPAPPPPSTGGTFPAPPPPSTAGTFPAPPPPSTGTAFSGTAVEPTDVFRPAGMPPYADRTDDMAGRIPHSLMRAPHHDVPPVPAPALPAFPPPARPAEPGIPSGPGAHGFGPPDGPPDSSLPGPEHPPTAAMPVSGARPGESNARSAQTGAWPSVAGDPAADDQSRFDAFKAEPEPAREAKPAPQVRNGWVLLAVLTAAVLLVALPLGIVWLATRPSESAFNVEPGNCVKQEGKRAVKAGCGDPDAFTVVSKVDSKDKCADPTQPHIVVAAGGGREQVLCLKPAGR